jgi:phospholipid transport system substrate-binding protein
MKFIVGLITFLILSMTALAQDVAPDALIRSVTDEVLEIVRTDKDLKSGNTKKALELVDTRVLPHFNFTRMTQLALGREWRKASPAQQKTLTDEFRELLVRTYSKALTEYKNQTIAYKPFSLKSGEVDVKVRTEIRQPSGGKPIELDYYLEKKGSDWKVYDIEVGGISLVMNYRDTFASEVSSGGIDGLVKALQTKNRAGDTAATKK